MPVEHVEAAVIRHYTSRAGDPHRHLHLQINARVFSWPVAGIHSVGIRDSIQAINGIGHAAAATDPAFRAVLAAPPGRSVCRTCTRTSSGTTRPASPSPAEPT
jgi:exodeoxyribonuclease V alpha subunit